MPFCPDPNYLSNPAMVLRERMMESYGMRVEAMDNLAVRSFANVKAGLLGVRSGLDWNTLHWVCAQVAGHEILERYGPAAVSDAVIPLQRRRLMTIYDRFGR